MDDELRKIKKSDLAFTKTVLTHIHSHLILKDKNGAKYTLTLTIPTENQGLLIARYFIDDSDAAKATIIRQQRVYDRKEEYHYAATLDTLLLDTYIRQYMLSYLKSLDNGKPFYNEQLLLDIFNDMLARFSFTPVYHRTEPMLIYKNGK